MKNSKYIDRSWWVSYLERVFPYARRTLPAQWEGPESFFGLAVIWYYREDVMVGFRMADGHWPLFSLKIIKVSYLSTVVDISMPPIELHNVQEHLTVIEAIAKPELCPLCIGIPWALPLVEHLLLGN